MTDPYRVRFEPVGLEIECGQDESVLDAAFRQGYSLVHGCREGQCSACKSFLLEGDVFLESCSSFALTETEESQGYTLLCRALPESDLVVELLHFDPDGLEMAFPIRQGVATISSVERVTTDIRRLVLEVVEPTDFSYLPGQYVDLQVSDRNIKRSFSMANLPGVGRLEFLIKIYPDGRFSGLLEEQLKPGDRVDFEGPYGSCYLRDRQTPSPVVLAAGGSGMAPVLAVLQQLANEASTRPVRFLYGARTEEDLFDLDVIEGLGRQLSDFRFFPVLSERWPSDWTGETGFVHDAFSRIILESEASLIDQHPDLYMAGPPPMVDAMLDLLEATGWDQSRIFYDKFTTASDVVIQGPDVVVLDEPIRSIRIP